MCLSLSLCLSICTSRGGNALHIQWWNRVDIFFAFYIFYTVTSMRFFLIPTHTFIFLFVLFFRLFSYCTRYFEFDNIQLNTLSLFLNHIHFSDIENLFSRVAVQSSTVTLFFRILQVSSYPVFLFHCTFTPNTLLYACINRNILYNDHNRCRKKNH